jgi:hypothetical protein
MISYCVGCPSPEDEGSMAYGLIARHGVKEFHVTGEVLYCIPNFAEDETIVNRHQFPDRIVFVNRGEISLLEKVLRIQEAGAAGVIIADDGRCTDSFSSCGPRAGSVADGGFAPDDAQVVLWSKVEIPVVLVTMGTAEKFRRSMVIEQVLVPRKGYQNATILRNPDGSREEL